MLGWERWKLPPSCQLRFQLVMPSVQSRRGLIGHLGDRGIQAVFHYPPLHLSKMGRASRKGTSDCPVTERVTERLVRLPMYFGLTAEEQREVIGAILEYREL